MEKKSFKHVIQKQARNKIYNIVKQPPVWMMAWIFQSPP